MIPKNIDVGCYDLNKKIWVGKKSCQYINFVILFFSFITFQNSWKVLMASICLSAVYLYLKCPVYGLLWSL